MVTGTKTKLERLGLAFWLLVTCASFLAAVSTSSSQDDPIRTESVVDPDAKSRPIETTGGGYITADNCRECHPHHYDTWQASHHRTMTQVPTKDSVIADFDNKVLQHSGRKFRFFEKDGEYFMEVKSARPSVSRASDKTFKVVLSTGAHHQQAFWCETDKGRTLAKIPFIWINKEQRWVPYGSIFIMPTSGLSMHAGIWNANCIKCHVVAGQPRLDKKKGFDSHVAEFGIACEACHGPGEAHATIHGAALGGGGPHSASGNAAMVDPAELSHEKSSQICGQCHAVFDSYDLESEKDFIEDGFTYLPGEDLHRSRFVFRFKKNEDHPLVKKKLKRNSKFWEQQFWSDGMVRVSGREYNGLLETPCYQRGTMSCLSCHEMHPNENDTRPTELWADDQMKPHMRGNQACVQCHEEYKSEEQLVLHTHHPADSAGSVCYNCHMPHTTLGLMKAMRSHTIDSPNVATTVSTGRPNACNLCHLDQTLAWTSKHLEDWYKVPAPKLSQQEQEVASSVRWVLQGDAGQRAIVGWHFGWAPAQQASGKNWMAPYLAELLTDSYDVVRFIGYHSLKQIPGFSEFDYDFVGSEQSRSLGKQRAMKIWDKLLERPFPANAVLINDQKRLMKSNFQSIRKQRLDPPMTLVE